MNNREIALCGWEEILCKPTFKFHLHFCKFQTLLHFSLSPFICSFLFFCFPPPLPSSDFWSFHCVPFQLPSFHLDSLTKTAYYQSSFRRAWITIFTMYISCIRLQSSCSLPGVQSSFPFNPGFSWHLYSFSLQTTISVQLCTRSFQPVCRLILLSFLWHSNF